eukprot:Nitzschia sp. Nitz4//scaffold131_size63436//40676//40993//NITZ4_006279-RA/size63436-processed-gene-0.69-mRNA-1//-1//CDS//3329535280//7989//frame0
MSSIFKKFFGEKKAEGEEEPSAPVTDAKALAEKAKETAATSAVALEEVTESTKDAIEEAKDAVEDTTSDMKCKMWFQNMFSPCWKGQTTDKLGAVVDAVPVKDTK